MYYYILKFPDAYVDRCKEAVRKHDGWFQGQATNKTVWVCIFDTETNALRALIAINLILHYVDSDGIEHRELTNVHGAWKRRGKSGIHEWKYPFHNPGIPDIREVPPEYRRRVKMADDRHAKKTKRSAAVEKVNQAVEMHKANTSQKEIAEKLGISVATVSNWLRKAGVLAPRKKRNGRGKASGASGFNVADLDAAIAILQRVKKLKEIFG